MAHTRIWDEGNPANSQAAAQGAGRIRDLKVDITERMAIDHYWDVDQDTDGWHKQVTMPESASDPSAVANQGKLYTKDDSGTTHLYYRDSAGTIYKLSGALSNVTIPWASITGVPSFVDAFDGLIDPDEDAYLVWDDSAGEWTLVPFSSQQAYGGFVGSDGSTGNDLPTGWSVTKNSTGNYTVNHTAGVILAPTVSPDFNGSNRVIAHVNNVDNNSFDVLINDDDNGGGGSARDYGFWFTAVTINN